MSTGRIYYTMHPPARNSRSQTGTPGDSRTQSVAGGHRASALHTVRRVPLVAPLPANPTVSSRVQLSSAKMGILAVQQMFLIDETRAADESTRTYITDDGESGDWFAAASSASFALSTNRVQTLPMRRSPYGGCAYKNCRHTRTL